MKKNSIAIWIAVFSITVNLPGRAEQRVVCWGNATSPIPSHEGAYSTGFVVIPNMVLSNAVQVAGALDGGIVLCGDGTVKGWGHGKSASLTNIVSVAAWERHYLALNRRGELFCWGGDSPVTGLTNLAAICRGPVALRHDGVVFDWRNGTELATRSPMLKDLAGGGRQKQWFVGLTIEGAVLEWQNKHQKSDWHVLPNGLSNFVAVAAGPRHSLALRRDGTVVQWGVSKAAREGVTISAIGDVLIQGRILTNIVSIAAGGTDVPPLNEFSLALREDGTVVGWGTLGWKPMVVPASITNIVAIAVSDTYCLALQER